MNRSHTGKSTNNPRIAIYVRCSTGEQNPDLQRRELARYAEARGWGQLTYFEDIGSGTNDKRVEFQRLMSEARLRHIDIVLTWKLDRFSRSLKSLVTSLQEFADVGVQFISLKDQIDMTTSSGRLLTHLLGCFAEFEADIIRTRVKAGLAAAKARGKRLGRPRVRNDHSILQLRAQGLSIRQIARRLNLSKGAVQRCLDLVPKTQKNGGEKTQ